MDKKEMTSEVNKELLERVYNLTLQYRNAHETALVYKKQLENLESNYANKESKALMEDLMDKLEELVNTNDVIEAENDDLRAKLKDLTDKLQTIEQESAEHAEIAENLEKEVKLMKENADEVENEIKALKHEKAKAEEDIAELKDMLDNIQAENENFEEKLAKIERERDTIVDENIGLKLDMEEKSKELQKVYKKLEEAEKKSKVAQNEGSRALVTQSNNVAWSAQHAHQFNILNSQIHFLNQQYTAVCQERDALRLHLNASQGQSREIINNQNEEIYRLKCLLDEANKKLWNLTPHSSIEAIEENYKKLQEQLIQIKASMAKNADENNKSP